MSKTKIRTRTSGQHKGKRYPIKNQGPQGYSIAKGNPTTKGITREDIREARIKKATRKKAIKKHLKELEEEGYKKKIGPRFLMLEQWKEGHKGDTDMSFDHSNKEFFSYKYGVIPDWNAESDYKELDMPRKNIISYIGPTGRKIYIGGGNIKKRKLLLAGVKNKLDNNFTNSEVLEMGPLYVGVGKLQPGRAGQCEHVTYIKHKTHITGKIRTPHIISIDTPFIEDAAVLTHEFIHAKRWGFRDRVEDRNRAEKETDLETMCRLSPSDFELKSTAGYYRHIPEIEKMTKKHETYKEGLKLLHQYEEEDRKLIIGDKSRMRGPALKRKIDKLYYKTHISKAKFSPGEKLDRFFIIQSDELTINEHGRYVKPVTLEEIKTGYRKTYPGAKVWEIRDGVKVRII